jgi:hypothetical protein
LEGRISKLPLGKGNKLKERSWRFTEGEGSLLGWGKEKGLVLMGEKVLFMREMCARIKHGRISMTKPLKFYFKQLFLPNPPLDLCETLKNICLGGLKGSLQISASSIWL